MTEKNDDVIKCFGKDRKESVVKDSQGAPLILSSSFFLYFQNKNSSESTDMNK